MTILLGTMASSGMGTGFVQNGLILHYDVSNLASYPGSGNTLYDLSGYNNNATLTNGVQLFYDRWNLNPNPSFEGTAYGYSSGQTAGTIWNNYTTAYSKYGSYSGYVTTSSGAIDNNIFYVDYSTRQIAPQGNGIYTLSAWFYVPVGSPLAGQFIYLYPEHPSGEVGFKWRQDTNHPLEEGKWIRVARGIEMTGLSYFPALVARIGTFPPFSYPMGHTIYTDGWQIDKGSITPYFDGSTSALSAGSNSPYFGGTQYWTGGANSSSSYNIPSPTNPALKNGLKFNGLGKAVFNNAINLTGPWTTSISFLCPIESNMYAPFRQTFWGSASLNSPGFQRLYVDVTGTPRTYRTRWITRFVNSVGAAQDVNLYPSDNGTSYVSPDLQDAFWVNRRMNVTVTCTEQRIYKVYVNGQLKVQSSPQTTAQNTGLSIDNIGDYINDTVSPAVDYNLPNQSIIYNASVYNRALTDGEVSRNWNSFGF